LWRASPRSFNKVVNAGGLKQADKINKFCNIFVKYISNR